MRNPEETRAAEEVSSQAFKYLIEENKGLRSQIREVSSQIVGLERWALISSGAFWSWLAAGSPAGTPGVVKWVPAVIAAFLGFRAFGLHVHNTRTGRYIQRVERAIDLSKGLGWETHLENRRYKVSFEAMSVISAAGYWVLLVLLNTLIAVLLDVIP